MQSSNRKNLFILSFTLVVVTLGFGVVIPIIPFYMESLGAGGTELGLLVASYAVMRLICAPIWGSISDRIGRKPVMMIGIFGYGITMFLFGLATELWMLFAARILSGILSSATSPTTMAYIGDSTSEEDRGGGMGILGAAVGLGTIFGPALGGLLAGESLSTPFFIAGGMSILALFLTWILLPESLPKDSRQASERKIPIPELHLWWQALSSPIGILLVLAFILTCGLMIFYGIFGLYALERFGFGPEEVGIIFMVVGLVSAITQGILTGPLTRRWGESLVIKIGMFGSAVSLFLIAWAENYWAVLITIGLFVFMTAILTPAISSLTSKRAETQQGMAMGLSNSFMSLGRIAGPLWAGFALDLNLILPFTSGALVMLIGFIISLIWLRGNEPTAAIQKDGDQPSPS
ncbi:MAG: MFS transporter [Anaerolineales bacterium]|jgi:DHA1 family multidrug resistance protein-like MFS transporter